MDGGREQRLASTLVVDNIVLVVGIWMDRIRGSCVVTGSQLEPTRAQVNVANVFAITPSLCIRHCVVHPAATELPIFPARALAYKVVRQATQA